ncbi:MAG: Uma2 family endonuclease [Planctomycetes bacterium]|nr:Uma2 family endonuclease [Planctomycetota bacterium]
MPLVDSLRKLTVEEFLALPECPEKMELVDGEVVVSPRPTFSHQEFIAHLVHLFRTRVGLRGRVVIKKEMFVHLPEGEDRIRVPDLCFISEGRQEIITEEAIRGPADLVVEILSESSEELDRISKREEYRLTGVLEYWIVDIRSRAVLVHDFTHGRQAFYRGSDEFMSGVLHALGLPCRFSIQELFEIIR